MVCPAIKDNEEANLISIDAVEEEYRRFFANFGVQIGGVNGKMDNKESEQVMSSFASGGISVLLSTTVVEVGVNVPNATVIVIGQAERFGLAILHQLRGRIGRGGFRSYCILHSDETDNERLTTIAGTNDGFKIAEADLKMRGSGDLLGIQQDGMNRHIDLMLTHPDEFKYAQEIADFCLRNGFGNHLVELYSEHELIDAKK